MASAMQHKPGGIQVTIRIDRKINERFLETLLHPVTGIWWRTMDGKPVAKLSKPSNKIGKFPASLRNLKNLRRAFRPNKGFYTLIQRSVLPVWAPLQRNIICKNSTWMQ